MSLAADEVIDIAKRRQGKRFQAEDPFHIKLYAKIDIRPAKIPTD